MISLDIVEKIEKLLVYYKFNYRWEDTNLYLSLEKIDE